MLLTGYLTSQRVLRRHHTVLALTLVDEELGKQQLNLMLQERSLHPNEQIPAYEWNFGDVNPPVHAWSTIFTYRLEKARTGQGDLWWLERAFQKLVLNFIWWVKRKDRSGKNVFEVGAWSGQHRRVRPQRPAADRWQLFECAPTWEGNWAWDCFLAFAWEAPSGERLLVTVNYAPNQSQCYVRLPFMDPGNDQWRLEDLLGHAMYDREGNDLQARRLYLDVPPWQTSVFALRRG
jgi:hypothetical protein